MRALVVCLIGAVICMVALVDSNEHKSMLSALTARAATMFAQLDQDVNDLLSIDEFRRFSGLSMTELKAKLKLSKQEAKVLLKRYDENGDHVFSPDEFDKLFKEADADVDGGVTQKELLDLMIAMAKTAHHAAGVMTESDNDGTHHGEADGDHGNKHDD